MVVKDHLVEKLIVKITLAKILFQNVRAVSLEVCSNGEGKDRDPFQTARKLPVTSKDNKAKNLRAKTVQQE